MRAYEIVYILDSALEREAVDAKLETFHATLDAQLTAVDHWGVRQLAYPIRNAKAAYYVIVHVTADPVALPEFERLLKLDEEIMRYLIVVNDGQPTSGASVLADRHANLTAKAAAPDTAETTAPDTAKAKGSPEAEKAADEEDKGEDEPPAVSHDAVEVPRRSGPPEFSGARGRRRRHEGPPVVLLNYKDVTTLARFLTEQGKILPKRTTKVSARFQRQLGTAVKRARHVALLPYIKDHEG